jgi:hypothetical protein
MTARLICAVTAATLVVCTMPCSAVAQRKGTIEIGAFARYLNYDNAIGLDNAAGVGGRVALYLGPTFAIEVDLARSPDHTPLHVRAAYEGPVSDRVEALVGFGFVRNWYGAPYHLGDGGISGLLGLRYRASQQLWLRIGLDLDAMFHTSDESPFNFYTGNWGLHVGAGVPLNR